MARDTLIQIIERGDVSFDHYSCKAKVRVESEALSGGGKMNIRMKKDSIIWFNFKKVSIEGARGLITPEEYSILYRTEKQYEQGSLEDMADHFNIPLDFSQWQMYLAGSIPQPDMNNIKMESSSLGYKLVSIGDLSYQYDFDLSFQMIKYQITDAQNRTLAVEVEDYDPDLGLYKKRKLTLINHQKVEATIEMEQSDIEKNVRKNMPFSIPDHYTRI